MLAYFITTSVSMHYAKLFIKKILVVFMLGLVVVGRPYSVYLTRSLCETACLLSSAC